MSPTVFIYKNYRFMFFSREETRSHVHITSPEGEAKFWLEPTVELAKSFGFSEKQINELKSIVIEKRDEILDKWKSHFGR
jgi:hypothetical protein